MQPLRVLCFVRDPTLRTALVDLLAAEGHGCRAPDDLQTALESLEREDVDVVLGDPEDQDREGLALFEAARLRSPAIELVGLCRASSTDVLPRILELRVRDLVLEPLPELQRVRETLRDVAHGLRLTHQNVRLQRELRSVGEEIDRLGHEVRGLSRDLMAVHADAKARGGALDLSVVFDAGLAAISRFAGGREAALLRYDARARLLRGERSTNPGRRLFTDFTLPIEAPDRARFSDLTEAHPMATLLRDYFGDETLVALPLWHLYEPLGVLVVTGPPGTPLGTIERRLLGQLAEWLALLFEESRLYKTLLDLVAVDSLTGLYNHRFFQDRLAGEVARAQRQGGAVSLLFCDLDDFKLLNDRHGHAAGDAVLVAIAQILRGVGAAGGADPVAAMRGSDFAARYGGEEFVVVLPDTIAHGAVVKAERLRAAVERATVHLANGTGPAARITMSIGVAELPRDARDKNGLIEAADRAMYEAKRAGKNRVVEAAALASARGGAPSAE